MDTKRQILNKVVDYFNSYRQLDGVSLTKNYDYDSHLSMEISLLLVSETMEMEGLSTNQWCLNTSSDIVLTRDEKGDIAGYLYPEDVRTFFFTFNFEATYLGVSLKDKCIPVKAIDRMSAASYIDRLILKEKKAFKKVNSIICEEAKPTGLKLIFYCSNVHDADSTGHIRLNFEYGKLNPKICYIL